MSRMHPSSLASLLSLVLLALPAVSGAQTQPRREVVMDTARARALYVSNRPEDHPQRDHARDQADKALTDSVYAARARDSYDFRKITYPSSVDGMQVPAYVFQPLEKRGPRGHAAMIWVHGGVHGDWGTGMFPFVKEAVDRGYVIVTPDYRGSTGHGAAHYNAIDYGGKEVDDVMSAYDWIVKNLPHVDPARVGMMGWSHGGFITAHSLFRDQHPFKAGAAMVPVSNLVFRLGFKGPGYARSFATQAGIGGMPHEKQAEYIRRSPVYQVDKLQVPMLVHVSTNDLDVNYEEDVQMIWALKAQKPHLAETKVYVDPPGWGSSVGHAFNRRTDPVTLERVDTPEQIDSWNRTWTFFEWNLRPGYDASKPAPNYRTR